MVIPDLLIARRGLAAVDVAAAEDLLLCSVRLLEEPSGLLLELGALLLSGALEITSLLLVSAVAIFLPVREREVSSCESKTEGPLDLVPVKPSSLLLFTLPVLGSTT